MKTKMRIILVLICLVTLSFSKNVFSTDKNQIDSWLQQLNNSNWQVRSGASRSLFYCLSDSNDEKLIEKIKTTLIEQLIKEIDWNENGQLKDETRAGESGDYLFDLAEYVASFKDTRAIPSLVRFGPFGSVREALLEFGEPAAIEILNRLEIKFPALGSLGKKGYIEILGEMTKPKNNGYVAEGKIRNEIKQALIKILETTIYPEDKNIKWYYEIAEQQSLPRKAAINALGNLGDTDIIPIIKSIAEKDSFSYMKDASIMGGKKGEKITIYPVREAAKKVLEELKARQKQE